MTDRKGLVPVTQADRDAAEQLDSWLIGPGSLDRAAEVLARHRADALTEALTLLKNIRRHAAHGKAGDWSIALNEIQREASAFIAQHEGEGK